MRPACPPPGSVGPGWGFRYRAQRMGRLLRAGQADAAETDGAIRRRVLDTSLTAPARSVYGAQVHTPMPFAHRRGPRDLGARTLTPWASEREGATFPAAPGLSGMSGLLDDIGDWWERQIQKAKVKLQTLLGHFLIARHRLQAAHRAIGIALQRTTSEAVRSRLVALQSFAADLIQEQGKLEGEVSEAQRRFAGITGGNDGLGLVVTGSVAAIGAVIAFVTFVAGKVWIHTQQVNSLTDQLDRIAGGELTPDELAQVKDAGQQATFGATVGRAVGATLPLVVLAGVGLYLWQQRR